MDIRINLEGRWELAIYLEAMEELGMYLGAKRVLGIDLEAKRTPACKRYCQWCVDNNSGYNVFSHFLH